MSGDDDSSNAGATVGIIVGILCLIGLIILAIVVIYFVKRWHDRNRIAHQKFKDEEEYDSKHSSKGLPTTLQTYDNPTYELN